MKKLYPWQSNSWQSLQALRNRMPGALLLKGTQGIGKFDLALLFAQSLLCESPLSDAMPCQQCQFCHWFAQNSHPDFRLVQPDALSLSAEKEESKKKPSKEIGVDQVRALTDFVNLPSHQGGFRIVLIHPAEAMNLNSANALLKTLEEPTDQLLFILVTHKPQQLLATILSRCLVMTLETPAAEVGLKWLREQGFAQPAQILAEAGFAPLQAQLRLENKDDDKDLLGLLRGLQQPETLDVLALAESVQKIAPNLLVLSLSKWCYDLSSLCLSGRVRYFSEHLERLNQLALQVSVVRLLQFQQELKIAQREASHPLNAKLQMEALLFRYLQIFNLS